MKETKQVLKELEAEVTRLYNRQVTILGQYGDADKKTQDKLQEEYDALHWRIKALNRRIVLLKNEM